MFGGYHLTGRIAGVRNFAGKSLTIFTIIHAPVNGNWQQMQLNTYIALLNII